MSYTNSARHRFSPPRSARPTRHRLDRPLPGGDRSPHDAPTSSIASVPSATRRTGSAR